MAGVTCILLPVVRQTGELEILDSSSRTAKAGVLSWCGETGDRQDGTVAAADAKASVSRWPAWPASSRRWSSPSPGCISLCADARRLGLLAEPQRRALSVAFGLASEIAPTGSWSPSRRSASWLRLREAADAVRRGRRAWLDQASAQVLGSSGAAFWRSGSAVFAVRTPARSAAADHLAVCPNSGWADWMSSRLGRCWRRSSQVRSTRAPRPDLEETHGHPLALLELYRGRSAADLAGDRSSGRGRPAQADRRSVRSAAGELPAEVQRWSCSRRPIRSATRR